jgi:hypothetical protein
MLDGSEMISSLPGDDVDRSIDIGDGDGIGIKAVALH